jgi:hypothetical protein
MRSWGEDVGLASSKEAHTGQQVKSAFVRAAASRQSPVGIWTQTEAGARESICGLDTGLVGDIGGELAVFLSNSASSMDPALGGIG